MLADLPNAETMSKVCQDDLFHPLLSVLSADDDHSTRVSSSPSQSCNSPDNQNLISTGSNTSPSFTNQECPINDADSVISQDINSPISILNSGSQSDDTESTVSQQTVTTTIPSHPSTIQYIPIIQTPITQSDSAPLNVRTVHLISATVSQADTSTTENAGRTSTIHYQYVPTMQQNRNTIHYPPSNIQIIHSGSSLIMSSNSLITAALQSVQAAAAETSGNNAGNNFLQIIPTSSAQNSAVVRNIQVMSLASGEQTEQVNETSNTDNIGDQNIRVLTPSEIMKTLPSLGQESFDGASSTVSSSAARSACMRLRRVRVFFGVLLFYFVTVSWKHIRGFSFISFDFVLSLAISLLTGNDGRYRTSRLVCIASFCGYRQSRSCSGVILSDFFFLIFRILRVKTPCSFVFEVST